MADQSNLMRNHAAEARAAANAATLDNVRDRHLRAEAAWIAMAERSERTEAARDRREAERAEAALA